MENDKIYVRMVDGTSTLVPIYARQLSNNLFEILDDPEYADADTSVLFEFYPGDVVNVIDTANMDNEYQFDAFQIIKPSQSPDRNYWKFLFLGTMRLCPSQQFTTVAIAEVLERIKKELAAGTFFYRGVHELMRFVERELMQPMSKIFISESAPLP